MRKYSLSDIEALQNEYQDIQPDLEEIATKTKERLDTLISSLDITLSQPIQYRIKTWDSINNKLGRREVGVKKIVEIQDLIGFRAIVLFVRDVQKVGDIISKSFNLVRNYDTKDRLGVDKFGYLSTHYIFSLDNSEFDLPEYSKSNITIELQVRTLAQHLWAEVSHLLSYKREESVPPPILRELSNTAALLENVDSSFERILNARETYRKGIVNLETDNSLNVDILQVTLETLWPAENRLENEPYEYLLYNLRKNGVDTQKKLTSLIRKHRDDVIKRSAREAEYLRNLIKTHPPENGTIKIVSLNKIHSHSNITQELIEKVEKGIFYGHAALTGTALQFETGERNPLDPLD